jgi:hypothetical protein
MVENPVVVSYVLSPDVTVPTRAEVVMGVLDAPPAPSVAEAAELRMGTAPDEATALESASAQDRPVSQGLKLIGRKMTYPDSSWFHTRSCGGHLQRSTPGSSNRGRHSRTLPCRSSRRRHPPGSRIRSAQWRSCW